jgi:hypothetical protein
MRGNKLELRHHRLPDRLHNDQRPPDSDLDSTPISSEAENESEHAYNPAYPVYNTLL